MTQYIDKSALVTEIDRQIELLKPFLGACAGQIVAEANNKLSVLEKLKNFIDTLEVKYLQEEPDPYIQYASRESAIKAHAEDYSLNIESELFQQLTPEQQKLWRKDIEQACISGGYSGLNLAKDPRYKENLEVKKVDLEKEYKDFVEEDPVYNKLVNGIVGKAIAKHFFELGLKVNQKGE